MGGHSHIWLHMYICIVKRNHLYACYINNTHEYRQADSYTHARTTHTHTRMDTHTMISLGSRFPICWTDNGQTHLSLLVNIGMVYLGEEQDL